MGTHCYGGGGGDGNSGNSVGGTYGNNYSNFIDVFSMRVVTKNGKAPLQTIVALQDGPEVDRLLDHVKDICKDGVPNLDGIASKLRPVLTKHVAQMTAQAMNRNETVIHPPTEAAVDGDPVRRPLKEHRTESELSSSNNYKAKDRYECLMAPTIPVPGEEGFFGQLGPLITKALQSAKPIASQEAKKAVDKYGPRVAAAISGRLGGVATESSKDDGLDAGPSRPASRKGYRAHRARLLQGQHQRRRRRHHARVGRRRRQQQQQQQQHTPFGARQAEQQHSQGGHAQAQRRLQSKLPRIIPL